MTAPKSKQGGYSDILVSFPECDEGVWQMYHLWYSISARNAMRYTVCDTDGNHEPCSAKEAIALTNEAPAKHLEYARWVVAHRGYDPLSEFIVTTKTKVVRKVTAYFNTLHAGRKHKLFCTGLLMSSRFRAPGDVPKGLRQYFGLFRRKGFWFTNLWKNIDEAREDLEDAAGVIVRGNQRGAMRVNCKAEWYEPVPAAAVKAEILRKARRYVLAEVTASHKRDAGNDRSAKRK